MAGKFKHGDSMHAPYKHRYCAHLMVLFLFAVLIGCGNKGPARYDVSGRVTFRGEPVAIGRIQFSPDASRGNRGPAGFAEIRDGRYDTRAEGRGTVGGPMRVLIVGYDGRAEPGDETPNGKPLFTNFTTAIELPLEAATSDFDVP